ncbi:MAG: NAD(P)/FAD-dependent oxidoreductase [Bacteroidota bacterium]|nr:NAD(P)/FAD-dependent oxidoreductase [Bacteroidota bacterium]
MQKTLVVAGGGAAGFFCAVTAARLNPQLRVVLVEKTGKLLSKVKVSGGGRCNVTHACFSIPEMIRKYPRGSQFLKKTFHQFFTRDTINWFEERGVKLKEEADGRMFPVSNSSQTIIDCLMQEAVRYPVEIRLHHEIKSIIAREKGAGFTLYFSNEWSLDADFLCIASGGYPKPSMFEWILKTGHSMEEPVPSLFTFNIPENSITRLMGISVPEVIVKVAGTLLKERGPLLITHWGMSGPAILKLSAWGARLLQETKYHFDISVNWIPDEQEQSLRRRIQMIRQEAGARKITHKNPWNLPQRLWEWQLEQSGIGDIHWADLPAVLQNKLIQNLCNQTFRVQGKTTFKEEFVTAGGIQLREINPQTMESRIHPGLFFAGEVMDVDGITGGFNFQHAWTSGFISGKAIAGYPG